MKKILTMVFLLMVMISHAQNQRADTTTLAVFNTARNFMVTAADFGSDVTQDLMGEMVMAFDTIMVLKEHTVKDSSGRKPLRHQMERSANKLSNVRGKIAVIQYNKDYDVTQMCMNAQRGGAIALVIIHESNEKKVYKLSKKGIYKDSIRIPCFTIPNNKGEQIIQLLPSIVGIKAPLLPPVRPDQLVASTNNGLLLQADKLSEKVAEEDSEYANNKLSNGINIGEKDFFLAPNPSHNQTTLTYQFAKATDATIEVLTASGQVILSQILRGIIVGSLNISTSEWADGTYILSIQLGKDIKTKKFVVQH